MLDLSKEIYPAKGSEKDESQQRIEKADREIDEMVYGLYEITEDAREIIEDKK